MEEKHKLHSRSQAKVNGSLTIQRGLMEAYCGYFTTQVNTPQRLSSKHNNSPQPIGELSDTLSSLPGSEGTWQRRVGGQLLPQLVHQLIQLGDWRHRGNGRGGKLQQWETSHYKCL